MASDTWWLTNEPLYPGGERADCLVYSGQSWFASCDQHEVPVGACTNCAWAAHFAGRDEQLEDIEWIRLHADAKWHLVVNGKPHDQYGYNVLARYRKRNA